MLSGTTLRTLRLRAGWSQTELARTVGIPASVLSAYERGRRQPGLEIAGRIIETLGYRVEFVAGLDPREQAAKLVDVLRLAEELPFRARPLATARFAGAGAGWASARRTANPERAARAAG